MKEYYLVIEDLLCLHLWESCDVGIAMICWSSITWVIVAVTVAWFTVGKMRLVRVTGLHGDSLFGLRTSWLRCCTWLVTYCHKRVRSAWRLVNNLTNKDTHLSGYLRSINISKRHQLESCEVSYFFCRSPRRGSHRPCHFSSSAASYEADWLSTFRH